MKRAVDVAASGLGLLFLSPAMSVVAAAVWVSDKASPIYAAQRCGLHGRNFTMYKFRSMVSNADSIGGSSTSNKDPRITAIGTAMRATKFDELPQLINVFKGDMSLVGPRPNIDWEVDTYSSEEQALLNVRPGITDLASIVFADEGAILAETDDPDLAYEQLIRPWKSHLGLVYVNNAGVRLDLRIIGLTLLNSIDRAAALQRVSRLVASLGASNEIVDVSLRARPLVPTPPPGHTQVIGASAAPALSD